MEINFKPNEHFKYFLYFISERQNIFWNRLEGKSELTEDPIFQEYKFTNVYRVLDRSSQFLIKEVIGDENFKKRDLAWRIFLYKHFNLPTTWEFLESKLGTITTATSIEKINSVLTEMMKTGQPIYSNAYMVTAFTGGSKYGALNHSPKHEVYLYKILSGELLEGGLLDEILESKSFEELYQNIHKLTNYGDFVSYQIAQDLNYTSIFDFDDDSFCSAGPGTKRGIERVFEINGKANYSDIVMWVQSNIEMLLQSYNIKFRPLPNHLPTVPDISSGFCETDKLLRGMGIDTDGKNIDGKRIKNKFLPSEKKINFVFPNKWNLQPIN